MAKSLMRKFDRVMIVDYDKPVTYGTVLDIDDDGTMWVAEDNDQDDHCAWYQEYSPTIARQKRFIVKVGRSYEMIRRWGVNVMHSADWYVNDQIEIAAMDNAPQNAIFKRDTGVWATTDDIAHKDIRVLMGMEN